MSVLNYNGNVFLFNGSALSYVASENFDGYFVIIAGQSNGTDRFTQLGNLPVDMQGAQSNSFTYYKSTDDLYNNGSWVNMEAGVNTQTGTPQTGMFGVSVVLAHKLFNTYGKPAYVVPTAVGGTYIANDVTPSWNVSHLSMTEYNKRCMELHVYPAYQKIRETKKLKPVLVWVHGESDSDTVAHGNDYEDNITDFFNQIRVDSGFTDMPIIIPKIRSDYGGPSLGLNAVRLAVDNVANNMTNVFIIDMDTSDTPLSSDGQHYNPIVANYSGTQSAINLGYKIADAIDTFVKPISQPQWTAADTIDSEASALIAAMAVAPDSTRQQVIQDFFINYKKNSCYRLTNYQFGFFSMLAAHDSQAGLLWWNNPSVEMILGGTVPTYTTDRGYKGTGAGWIDTLFNTLTGDNFQQDNGALFVYIRDNIAESATDVGILGGAVASNIQARDLFNNVNATLNQGGSASFSNLDSRGFFHVQRTGNTSCEIFKNGVSIGTFNNSSVGPDDGNLYLFAFNYLLGAPFAFSTKQIAFAGAGNKYIDPVVLYNSVQAYMTSIGANV